MKEVDTKEYIKRQIRKFMGVAIDTDVDIMTEIIAAGLVEELSVPQIRQQIIDKFDDYNKTQADRITRTEVIKTSNLGAQDAFEQSGVVEAKQWLATEDDRTDAECSELDGKIIGLEDSYFEKGDKFMGMNLDYDDVDYPPLHPNCRCVILPVLVGEKGFESQIVKKVNNDLKERIVELESQMDKRTKDFKEMKSQHDDDQVYIATLEKYLGVSDE